MTRYELAYSFRRAPDDVETWLIERVTPNGLPHRINFKGTRKEAEAEVARLNAAMAPEFPDNAGGS